MQTTLLAVGIAIILALLTALVGPFFINWNDYRALFEARAAHVIGMPVRIAGPIEARLLPVPAVVLRDITVRGGRGETRLKARELGVEFALGALVRGEWKATELRLIGAEAQVRLDAAGRLAWTGGAGGIDPDALSIERVSIEDGRLILADAGSGAQAVLDRFWFAGEMRSLLGPAKGEGGFLKAGERFGYRLTAGRWSEDAVRLRLALDPADRPLSAEADGVLRLENGAPRFEGTLSLARLSGVMLSRGRAITSEPWRLTSRVNATAAGALFEQLELHYGPEERALKLSGAADLKLGPRPRLETVLSARQLDLDGLVALPEHQRRLPLVALGAAMEALGDALQPPIPVRIGIGVDSVTLGGGAVQTLRGDFFADAAGWDIETLEFRTPGFAQVRASGRLSLAGNAIAFNGPASIEATDPTALIAWLEGRSGARPATIGPLRASGTITLASDRIAVEQLKAEIDRRTVAGRFAYVWTADGRAPKLDAALQAADLDLDAAATLIRTALPGISLDVPAELALALELGRATLSGVEARDLKAKLRLDAGGLAFDQLTIADLAGARIELAGRIAGPWAHPRGDLSFDFEGARVDGALTLLDRVAPQLAATLRPLAPQLGPAKLRASLAVSQDGRDTAARLRLNGAAGALRLSAAGDLIGAWPDWRAARLKAEGAIEAAEARALAALFGFERLAVIGAGPGALRFSATGPLGGELGLDLRLAAPGLTASAKGGVRVEGDGVGGAAQIALSAQDAVALRPTVGKSGGPVPATLRARLSVTPQRLAFDELTAAIAGTTLNGHLALARTSPVRVEGRLDADTVDASALLSALIGMPPAAAAGRSNAGAAATWPAQPFGPRLLGDLSGQLELRANRAALTPTLEIRQFATLLRFGAHEVAVEDITGVLGGGRLVAQLKLPRGPEGTTADVRFALNGADITALLPGDARSPVSGRISVQLEAKGSGRSPASLVGALGGAGSVSVEAIEITGLDPRIFEIVTKAVDQGFGVDPLKVKNVIEAGLEHGRLRIAQADGTLALTAGQLRLGGVLGKGEHADLGVSASIDLVQALLDARLTLIGRVGPDGPAAGRPEIFVALKGPINRPKRSIDVSALVGWLTLRAVELQARRLEALEAERRALEAAKAGAAAPPVSAPAAAAPRSAAPEPAPAISGPVGEPQARAPTEPAPEAAIMHAGPKPPPPGIAAPRSPAPAAAQSAPALPPPIDIRPAPQPRPSGAAARPRQAGGEAMRLRPAEAPPLRSRTLFDLFGAAR